jgi:hypothetical protein
MRRAGAGRRGDRERGGRARRLVLAALCTAASTMIAACALGGDEAPGCHADADCAPGSVCRSGACFSVSTGLSAPHDPARADAGDAAARD